MAALRVLAGTALVACGDGGGPLPGPCSPEGPPPSTIGDVVDRLDRLDRRDAPSPVSLPCFLASLPRPLPLEASSDVFSAQPAVGERSPRMFVRYPDLTLTVAPEGPGATLLELGEADGALTVKAELQFPVEVPVAPTAPYERVSFDDGSGTGCGMCHGGEVEVADGVFASIPLQPLPTLLVPLQVVAAEAAACGSATDDRCAMLGAVFGHGEVIHTPFPADMPTIYDPR
jgi:hypothetical protein